MREDYVVLENYSWDPKIEYMTYDDLWNFDANITLLGLAVNEDEAKTMISERINELLYNYNSVHSRYDDSNAFTRTESDGTVVLYICDIFNKTKCIRWWTIEKHKVKGS